MATYSGPADNLILNDQAYHPGDEVPISAEQQAALESTGHVFSDTDLDAVAAANMSMPLAPLDTAPRDARGAPITFERPAEPTPTTTAPSTTTTAAPKATGTTTTTAMPSS